MGRFVVKYKKLILALAAILLIPAFIGFMKTGVNYDMLNYLPNGTDTMTGQEELLKDFEKGAFSVIITEDLPDAEEAKLEQKIKEVPHVSTVLGLGSLTGNGIPSEILPDSILSSITAQSTENGATHTESAIAVFFDASTSADETITAIKDIRRIMDGHAYVSGMSSFITDLRNLSEQEELMYIVIAVILAIIVMLLLLDNWLAPIFFLVSIGIMIIFNMGTNFMFGEISYITKALAAILQLAVTMDYSIFLWHSYREYLSQGDKSEKAMERAIKATLSSVLGSSTTTIAGFIALCFMSFTLGLDLGLVMTKGVILGVIGSVTVLPALILIFDKTLKKFDHKSLMPDFTKISDKIVKIAPALIAIFVVITPIFFIAYRQTNNDVYYTLTDSLPQTMEFAVANKKLDQDFGLSNVHMVLSPVNLPSEKMIEMSNEIKSVKGIKSVLNLATATNGNIPVEMLPDELVKNLRSDKWELSLIVSEYHTATDEMSAQVKELNDIIKKYDNSTLLIGEAALTDDMIKITSVDFAVVNTISIVAIFIIIAIVTKSLSLPVILIAVIECSIFINLGLSHFFGQKLSFIAPICISTIQLGATIDYAILMTARYKSERLSGKDKKKAAIIALKTSIPSIVVSGAVLFAATIGVAIYSQADMISSLTMLMARGAVISVVAVPAFLGPLLVCLDPLIIRTTIGMKELTKGVKK